MVGDGQQLSNTVEHLSKRRMRRYSLINKCKRSFSVWRIFTKNLSGAKVAWVER